MVHGRGCNPHRSTTTFTNLEITSLWRNWWQHNSESIREKRRPPRPMKSSELSNENRIALWQLLQNRRWRHWWRHNLGSSWRLQKMAPENFSIGALYNITKNQDNPIKTVGRDSFWAPKPLKMQVFTGHPAPRGRPYILGDTTRPRHMCPSLIEIGSKTVEKNSAQTNRQTDRHYENNGHLGVNQNVLRSNFDHQSAFTIARFCAGVDNCNVTFGQPSSCRALVHKFIKSHQQSAFLKLLLFHWYFNNYSLSETVQLFARLLYETKEAIK